LGDGVSVVAPLASDELVGPPSGCTRVIEVGDRFALESVGHIQFAIGDRSCEMFLGRT